MWHFLIIEGTFDCYKFRSNLTSYDLIQGKKMLLLKHAIAALERIREEVTRILDFIKSYIYSNL